MFIFNKNISFLRPRSVLSSVRAPTPPFLCVFVTARSPPPLPSGVRWDGPAKDWPVQRGPSHFEDSQGGRWGGVPLASQSRNESTVLWDNPPVFFSLCPWYLDFVTGQNISTTLLETSDSVSVCWRVCSVYSFTWRLHMCVKSSAERDVGYRKTGNLRLLLLLTVPHTHAHTHTTVFLSLSVFLLPPINIVLLSPSGRSWGEVSQSVFLFVFEYCILLFLFKLPLV